MDHLIAMLVGSPIFNRHVEPSSTV